MRRLQIPNLRQVSTTVEDQESRPMSTSSAQPECYALWTLVHSIAHTPEFSPFGLFDGGFEAGESAVPLLRDAVEEEARLGELPPVERPTLFAAAARGGGDTGAGQHVQVLGDRLAGHLRARGELRDRERLAPGEADYQAQASGIAQSGEERGRRFDTGVRRFHRSAVRGLPSGSSNRYHSARKCARGARRTTGRSPSR